MSSPHLLAPFICWLVGLPLALWGETTGPAIATVASTALLVVGFYLFTAWAVAGGMPPMYRG